MAVIRLELIGRPGSTAVAAAVVGIVSVRRDDPVVPAQLAEVHVELFLAALARCGARAVHRSPAHAFRAAGAACRIDEDHQEGPVVLVVNSIIRQRWLWWWWFVEGGALLLLVRQMVGTMALVLGAITRSGRIVEQMQRDAITASGTVDQQSEATPLLVGGRAAAGATRRRLLVLLGVPFADRRTDVDALPADVRQLDDFRAGDFRSGVKFLESGTGAK